MRPIKVMFVGKAGSGKSLGYYDAPKPHIVQDADNKAEEAIRSFFRGKVKYRMLETYNGFDPENLKEIQILAGDRSFDQYFNDSRAIINNPPMKANQDPGTWTMDSCTMIADNTINYSLAQRTQAGKTTGIIPIPDLPEWMAESMYLSSLFSDMKQLPCNVILVAHHYIVERELMLKKTSPSAPGSITKITKQIMTGGTKIGVKIPTYFSEIYNFQGIPPIDIRDGRASYRVFTSITEEFDQTRTRLPLPYEIDITYEPGKPSLWEHIEKAQAQLEEEIAANQLESL